MAAIRKREIYGQLFKCCDLFREAGLEPYQYKNYILPMLFLKFASDLKKRATNPFETPFELDENHTWDAIVKDVTKGNLASKFNNAFISFGNKNSIFKDIIGKEDFAELKKDKISEQDQLLSSAITCLETLDLSSNRANDDDILGDAYEYLMRTISAESGKTKGQFYTPAEVSRILARIIRIEEAQNNSTTLYDPACGSASLLIRAAELASCDVSIYGQELVRETASLALMNCFLHKKSTAEIHGNESTLSSPYWLDKEKKHVRQFDFVVVNPPFSLKHWDTDVNHTNDYDRFSKYELKSSNGDYAWLLHVIHSMKDGSGRAAIILPHGVLFRGGVEAEIRRDIVQSGILQGIIGLPANLFYGTGIPACILMLDKGAAASNKGIFFVDASQGYIKDGNKNRLREQDIEKIVETFLGRIEIDHYAHFASLEEIEKNEYNLNIPRYVVPASDEPEQNLNAHLNGGIPTNDIDAFEYYWRVFPKLRKSMFKPLRKGFETCTVAVDDINNAILNAPGMHELKENLQQRFDAWKREAQTAIAPCWDRQGNVKAIEQALKTNLRNRFDGAELLDIYDVYQVLMTYLAEDLRDDIDLLCLKGAEVGREIEVQYQESKTKDKKSKNKNETPKEPKEKSWDGLLLPKNLVAAYKLKALSDKVAKEIARAESAQADLDAWVDELDDDDPRIDENSNDKKLIGKTAANKKIKDAKKQKDTQSEALLNELLQKLNDASCADKDIKTLDLETRNAYATLTREDIIACCHTKWFDTLNERILKLYHDVAYQFAAQLTALVERYQTTLSQCQADVDDLEQRVLAHLKNMEG